MSLELDVFTGFDPLQDAVWMAEAQEESTKVWTHKARIVLFLSAMRHFRDRLLTQGFRVLYTSLNDPENVGSLSGNLAHFLNRCQAKGVSPQKIHGVSPGEYQVGIDLIQVLKSLGIPFEMYENNLFLCSKAMFEAHAQGRKQLRMEFFYREMRKKYHILMEGEKPVGDQWNYDAENRGVFGKQGPTALPKPIGFSPDGLTQQVIEEVEATFPKHPGSLSHFDWPVTPEQAMGVLEDFIANRLPEFGQYQDAMWTNEPYLYHSRVSAAMNLGILNPRLVVNAVEKAYQQNQVSLASAEGFIRQVLGWREYVKGIYWLKMPEYLELNALKATGNLPDFYWTGKTSLNCLNQAIGQTLKYGYAHHIQRLMVTGLFALLCGVRPQLVHQWYLAVYVDAVEWVELPNTLGMSQYGDGGIMASKPYVASGKYIKKMSNYCQSCSYDPDELYGEKACPFNRLYWNFLFTHQSFLASNPRMGLQLKNLSRFTQGQQEEIQRDSNRFLTSIGVLSSGEGHH
ncbi:MAG: cryptochrome/photolyase family protein [Cyanobacteria bacterium]|nr:cryptochrome/photolyase family protein [Cyanobacteriota bacterium]